MGFPAGVRRTFRLPAATLDGTDPGDPLTYAAAVLGLAAAWLPARRAASTDPVRALEGE